MKIDTTSFFSAEGGPVCIKFRRLVQNDMSTAVIWSKSKPDVEFQYGERLSESHGMSSQSHMSSLQGAVTWRNQCHDCATLQGVRIPSVTLKIVFRHILLYLKKCSLGFDERRLSYCLRYTRFNLQQ